MEAINMLFKDGLKPLRNSKGRWAIDKNVAKRMF